jgi:hypothetical protein
MGRWKVKRHRYDPTIGVVQGTGAPPGRITAAQAAGHQEFIKVNWESLAWHAWRGYQERGRGALILDERELHTHDGSFRQVGIHLAYMGERSPEFPKAPDQDYVFRTIQEYDPRQEVLVMIRLRIGGLGFYRTRKRWVDPLDAKPNAN